MADMVVANEIARQIGNRALSMIGARDLIGSERALTFKIGRNERKVTHVRVTLGASDTYTVEFLSVRGTAPVVTRSTVSDIYCDALGAAIEAGTGLRVSL